MNIRPATISFLFITRICIAQIDSTSATVESQATGHSLISIVGNDGLTALQIAGHVLTNPTRWDGRDLLVAGGLGVATGASFFLDDETHRLMERNHASFTDDVTRVAVEYGSGYLAIGLPVTMYITGWAIEDTWLRETAMLMGTTVLLTSAITTAGKIIIGRARPYTGFGSHHFNSFSARAEFMSFPSGHTTVAFALSAVLAARIRNPWASVGLYGLATCAAASRIYTRDHWLSDVVFTGAYTAAVAHSVVHWFENEGGDGAATGFDIIPTTNGVCVAWNF